MTALGCVRISQRQLQVERVAQSSHRAKDPEQLAVQRLPAPSTFGPYVGEPGVGKDGVVSMRRSVPLHVHIAGLRLRLLVEVAQALGMSVQMELYLHLHGITAGALAAASVVLFAVLITSLAGDLDAA